MATNLVSSAIVHEVLTTDNYANWSVCVKTYLQGQNLWETVETDSKPEENEAELTNTSRKKIKTWRKKNAMALHVIQISCGPYMLSQIREISSAKVAWKILARMNDPQLEVLSEPRIEDRDYDPHVLFLKVVQSGNWEVMKRYLDGLFFDARRAKISSEALFVAIEAGHKKIVKELVQIMSDQDLEIQTWDGSTALITVAVSGNIQMAECMVEKNLNLVRIADNDGLLPVVRASTKGRRDMVRYLYTFTPLEELTPEKGTNGATLLSNCIIGEMFDVALDLLRRYPRLAFALDLEGTSPVYMLSQMSSAFPSGSHLVFWRRWIYSFIPVQLLARGSNYIRINIQQSHQGKTDRGNIVISGIKRIYDRKLIHIQALELLRYISIEIKSLSGLQLRKGLVHGAIFQAVKHGIVEFIIEIIKAKPDLLPNIDMDWRDILQCAIVYRQEKIFSLVYGLDAEMRDLLTSRVDRFDNNMLHLAGMLAHSTRLDHISGAALQMQRELQWFKEVERIVPFKFREEKNLDRKTPRELFIENHMNLLKEGEKWMKETATSCMVVATLIVTIMFAAAFTIPGGNNQDTGFPIFLEKKLYMVFIVSDVISFFASSASVSLFLGIFISRYGEDYFLKSLPKKMIIGFTTLFISILTMVVAFCAALLLMLLAKSPLVSIPIIILASIPIQLVILLQFPLFVETVRSTYGLCIFNRKTKRWY